jgi:hypothetical protein
MVDASMSVRDADHVDAASGATADAGPAADAQAAGACDFTRSDSCSRCIADRCASQMDACFGAGFRTGADPGGDCQDYGRCLQRCGCGAACWLDCWNTMTTACARRWDQTLGTCAGAACQDQSTSTGDICAPH